MAFNRRDFIKVCSGLFTSLAYCSAKPWVAFSAGRPTIRIGVISTLSGFLVDFGRGAIQAAKIAVEEFNNKGGILGRPVELYILDDSGKAVDVVRGIHQLAHQDAVAILGSAVMFQNKDVSHAAESAEIPLFLLNPFRGDFSSDRLSYTFRLQPQANLLVIQMVAYLLELAKRKGIMIREIGVFSDKHDLWQESLNSIYELARKNRIRIKFNYQFPPPYPYPEMERGLDTIFEKIRTKRVDIMVVLGYPSQMNVLVQGMKQAGIRSKAVVGFSNLAVSNPWFVKEQGRTLINVIDANYWGNPRSAVVRSFAERFYAVHGSAPSNDAYQAYSIMQVLKDAISYGRTTDCRRISRILHERAFPNHVLAQREPIRFDRMGQNVNAQTVLLQVSNPVPKIIYPDAFSEMEPVFEL